MFSQSRRSMVRICTIGYRWLHSTKRQHFSFSSQLFAKNMNTPVIYPSLNSILDILNQNKVNKPAVAQLLELYHSVKISTQDASRQERRHPLIVIEGLDGSGKSTITKALSRKIGAKLYCTPPPVMKDLRTLFDNEPSFRSAYYSLGNYIASMQLIKMLEESPVILDRFWHSTAAYAMAEGAKKGPQYFQMPPAGSDDYKWPTDLLKPDIVFFLSVSEAMRITRLSRRHDLTTQEDEIKCNYVFRENILKAYENMREPSIEKVNANLVKRKVIDLLYGKIQHLLVASTV